MHGRCLQLRFLKTRVKTGLPWIRKHNKNVFSSPCGKPMATISLKDYDTLNVLASESKEGVHGVPHTSALDEDQQWAEWQQHHAHWPGDEAWWADDARSDHISCSLSTRRCANALFLNARPTLPGGSCFKMGIFFFFSKQTHNSWKWSLVFGGDRAILLWLLPAAWEQCGKLLENMGNGNFHVCLVAPSGLQDL